MSAISHGLQKKEEKKKVNISNHICASSTGGHCQDHWAKLLMSFQLLNVACISYHRDRDLFIYFFVISTCMRLNLKWSIGQEIYIVWLNSKVPRASVGSAISHDYQLCLEPRLLNTNSINFTFWLLTTTDRSSTSDSLAIFCFILQPLMRNTVF